MPKKCVLAHFLSLFLACGRGSKKGPSTYFFTQKIMKKTYFFTQKKMEKCPFI